MSAHELWIGSSTVTGTQCNAHSRQAEGVKLLVAFTFLKKYDQMTTSVIHQSAQIKSFCDNLGVIQQIERL